MNRQRVIEFFAEARMPLSQKMIDSLENLDYAVFTAQCRVCNHTEVVIAPIENDLDYLECAECGNDSVQPATPDEELEIYQMNNFNQHRFFVS